MSLDLNSIGLLVLGFILTLFSSWFVARYTWKAQKDDERREKVYAPIHDELSNMKIHLDEYGFSGTKEYEQIRSTHLLYLVPKNLETEIHDLYDIKLPAIDAIKVALYPRFVNQILEVMGKSFDTFSDSQEAHSLAEHLAYCVFLGGIIGSGWGNYIEKGFLDMNHQFGTVEPNLTLGRFFENVLGSCSKDKDQMKLLNLKEEALQLIDSIQGIIATDLETRFWVWLYRRGSINRKVTATQISAI